MGFGDVFFELTIDRRECHLFWEKIVVLIFWQILKIILMDSGIRISASFQNWFAFKKIDFEGPLPFPNSYSGFKTKVNVFGKSI